MRLFADNIPGPIAYLDRSLRYTFVNQAFANSVCKPQDEIYGKTPFEISKTSVGESIVRELEWVRALEECAA
jgi:PAS domain-containing protein